MLIPDEMIDDRRARSDWSQRIFPSSIVLFGTARLSAIPRHRIRIGSGRSEEHRLQTNVEFKKKMTNKKTGQQSWEYCVASGKDNHLTDTDQMCLAAAIMDPKLQPILWTVEEKSETQTENES